MIVSKSYLPRVKGGSPCLRSHWCNPKSMGPQLFDAVRGMFQSKGGEKWETPVADDGSISIYKEMNYSRGGFLLCLVFFFWRLLIPRLSKRWWFYGTQVTALVMESSHWSDRCTERGDADRPIKIIRGIRPGMIFFTVLSEAFKGRFEVFCCLFLENIACLMCHMPQAFPRGTHVTSLEYPGNPGNWVEPIFGRSKAASDPCD